MSHVGYTYTSTEYLNNIFKLTHKLYLDKVFFLSSPSQILAKKIEKINLEITSPELLSEALFYLPKEKQKNIILELKDTTFLNEIAKKRTDFSSELINVNNTESETLEIFLSKLTIDTFETIAKSESEKFTYPTHIKNIFNLELFESDNQKIDFLKKINTFLQTIDRSQKTNPFPDYCFFEDYVNDTTTNIQLLMETFTHPNIFNFLRNANRLHEIKSVLINPRINACTKIDTLYYIQSYLKNTDPSLDENKTKLRESLAKINKVALWKEIFSDENKKKFDKLDIFKFITEWINLNKDKENEKAIKEIFTYEIENKTNKEFIPLSFLIHPTIANKFLKEEASENIITDLLIFYTQLIFKENKSNIDTKNLLLNIKTIFNEIEIPEKNETKNLATLLKKDISEILENESLKNEIKKNNLYKKFLFNEIMTKKNNIKSIAELEDISILLKLNKEQEAILICSHNVNYDTLEENKKTQIENIIKSANYKEKLTSTFNDFENLAEKIFFEKKNLSKESLENLATQYAKEEKTNFSDYEIKNIAILSFFKINQEKTKEIIAKLKKQKLEEKNELLENELLENEINKILEQIKSQKNLLIKEKIFIESINNLENIDEMLETLTIKDLVNTLLNNDLKQDKAIEILSQLIQINRKKARNVVKLMQKTNNDSFQKLYIKLDQKLKIDLTKEND